MRIGFDLDGTLASGWKGDENCGWIRKFFTGWIALFCLYCLGDSVIGKFYLNNFLVRSKLLLIPTLSIYVITSRPYWLVVVTKKWLRKNKITYCYLSMSSKVTGRRKSHLVERSKQKAKVINSLELDCYYEDEEETRSLLKRLCLNTEILSPEESIRRSHATAAKR